MIIKKIIPVIKAYCLRYLLIKIQLLPNKIPKNTNIVFQIIDPNKV